MRYEGHQRLWLDEIPGSRDECEPGEKSFEEAELALETIASSHGKWIVEDEFADFVFAFDAPNDEAAVEHFREVIRPECERMALLAVGEDYNLSICALSVYRKITMQELEEMKLPILATKGFPMTADDAEITKYVLTGGDVYEELVELAGRSDTPFTISAGGGQVLVFTRNA